MKNPTRAVLYTLPGILAGFAAFEYVRPSPADFTKPQPRSIPRDAPRIRSGSWLIEGGSIADLGVEIQSWLRNGETDGLVSANISAFEYDRIILEASLKGSGHEVPVSADPWPSPSSDQGLLASLDSLLDFELPDDSLPVVAAAVDLAAELGIANALSVIDKHSSNRFAPALRERLLQKWSNSPGLDYFEYAMDRDRRETLSDRAFGAALISYARTNFGEARDKALLIQDGLRRAFALAVIIRNAPKGLTRTEYREAYFAHLADKSTGQPLRGESRKIGIIGLMRSIASTDLELAEELAATISSDYVYKEALRAIEEQR